MRKVQFYGAVSLDGYLATKDHDLTWLSDASEADPDGMAEIAKTMKTFMEAVDTAIMGRSTYDFVRAQDDSFVVNPYRANTQSIVLTHHTLADEPHIQFTDRSVVELVKTLLNQSGDNIWIVGGSQVLMPLIDAGLVDDLIIQTVPVLLGDGYRLFTESDHQTAFTITDSRSYGSMVETRYHKLDV